MSQRTVIIRPAAPEEANQLFQFYSAQNDPAVLPRPEHDLRHSAVRGLFFVGEHDDALFAVAGVFDLGNVPYVELGGTLVSPPLRGFGLQKLLFQLRIAAVVINQGSDIRMLTAIDPHNRHSLDNAMKTGFGSWPTPIEEVFEPCGSCGKHSAARIEGRRCCCDFLLLSDQSAERAARELLSSTKTSSSVTLKRSSGDSLEVAIHSRLITTYRVALMDFAQGKRW